MTFEVLPQTNECWLVCGGRRFDDYDGLREVLTSLARHRGGVPAQVVHGNAGGIDATGKTFGADKLGGLWASRLAITVTAVPANWRKHGPSAGPIRNQKMLDDFEPELVIAFPGGKGTADMIRRAREAGVEVAEIKKNETP